MPEQTVEVQTPSKLDRFIEAVPQEFINIEAARALAQSCQGLEIDDVEDADQVAAVTEANREVKAALAALEKKRKELKAPLNAYGKAIDGHARVLKAELEPAKVALAAEIDKVKAHEAELARQKLEARLARLRAVESVYAAKPDVVEAYSDEGFEELVEAETAEHAKRQEEARIAKERAEREAEERRKAAEEAARLKAEQDAREKALAEERAEIERERAALRAEKDAAERAKREAEAPPAVDELPPAPTPEPVVEERPTPEPTAEVQVEERADDLDATLETSERPGDRDVLEALLAVAREAAAILPKDTKLGAMARAALAMHRESQAVSS